MPSTVLSLLKATGWEPRGGVTWATGVDWDGPGVYLVSMSSEPDENGGAVETAPIDESALHAWLRRVPQLRIDGAKADAVSLGARLRAFWLSDENVIYVGKATSLRTRLAQFYRTPLGERGPHAGGHWVKALSVLSRSYVYFAATDTPAEAECAEGDVLAAFVSGISAATRMHFPDLGHLIPFANLEFPKGSCKRHGLSKCVRR